MLTAIKPLEAVTQLTHNTPDEAIAELIDVIKQSPEHRNLLVALLPEQAPFYEGRSTNEIIRIRGYLLAAFETTGVPASAIPYVLEELESSCEAYLVAGAACAVRGFEQPTVQLVPYLLKAIENIRLMDDALTFASFKPDWPLTTYTSGLREIFKTFGWLGSYAQCALPQLKALSADTFSAFSKQVKVAIDHAIVLIEADKQPIEAGCCLPDMGNTTATASAVEVSTVKSIMLEDQDGNSFTFESYFCRKPTVVVFFYTRCLNPNKCSLTVTKLAQLQKALQTSGLETQIRTAAVTYDPAYDIADRIRAYGENRGILYTEDHKLIRVPAQFEQLKNYFGLGVNYVGASVNRHRIELYILDKNGSIVTTFSRLQWDVQEVLAKAKDVLEEKVKAPKRTAAGALLQQAQTILPPLLVAFFPKCAFCWAAYLSVFGIASLKSIPYTPELLPFFILLMLANLVWLYRGARQRNGLFPFYVNAAGALVLLAGMWFKTDLMLYAGIGVLFIGSVLNSLPYKVYHKLKSTIQQKVILRLKYKLHFS